MGPPNAASASRLPFGVGRTFVAWPHAAASNRAAARARGRMARAGYSIEQGGDELGRVEPPQIGDLLAHAHPDDGDLQLVADADDDPALGGPVDLGERD